MATAVTRGMRRIVTNRKFEDYESMKKYFSSYRTNGVNEIIFDGFQTLTNTAAALEPSDETIARIGAAGVVYLRTLVDDALQDSKEVWVTYQTDAGVIKGPITHLLAAAAEAGTEVVHALGDENLLDVISAGQGTGVVTLTTYNCTTVNDLAGQYLVCYSGDDKGIAYLIASNTVANPTVCTVSPNSGAAANADKVQIQEFPCDDYFRLRQMYCDVEANDDKTIQLGTFDLGTKYGCISREMNYNSSPNYFSTDAAYARCFLGKIVCKCSHESTDAKKQGNEIQVTLTPKAQNTDATASDIILNLVFQDELDWQPCIELEPATDVTIKILTLDNTNVDDMYIQVHYLEAR